MRLQSVSHALAARLALFRDVLHQYRPGRRRACGEEVGGYDVCVLLLIGSFGAATVRRPVGLQCLRESSKSRLRSEVGARLRRAWVEPASEKAWIQFRQMWLLGAAQARPRFFPPCYCYVFCLLCCMVLSAPVIADPLSSVSDSSNFVARGVWAAVFGPPCCAQKTMSDLEGYIKAEKGDAEKRGIPEVIFIENVEDFLGKRKPTECVAKFQELLSKYSHWRNY